MPLPSKTFTILGAAGKVGYATSLALRKAGKPVRAILRDPSGPKASSLRDIGCEITVADMRDSAALAESIGDTEAIQVILPSSPKAEDTAGEMKKLIESLAVVLEKVRPARVLAISDSGAYFPFDIGTPSICRPFEERLSKLNCHKVFLRSAEHMENWARVARTAIASGVLPSFLDPADREVPTISATDVGVVAADLLLRPAVGKSVEIVHAEGPRRYSASNVAVGIKRVIRPGSQGVGDTSSPMGGSPWAGDEYKLARALDKGQ